MSLIYLGVSCLAGLALSLVAFSQTGSLLFAIAVYAVTGTLVLTGVLLSAMLRLSAGDDEAGHTGLYPAE